MDKDGTEESGFDVSSVDSRLEQLKLMDDFSCVMNGTKIIDELSEKIKSAQMKDVPSITTCCDKILQKSLSRRGNLFQAISGLPSTGSRFIYFLEELLQKNMPLAVYNILLHQGSDNEAKPAGYQLAHGEHRKDFFEKIINKLPEGMARNLRDAAFVVYLDEEQTEAVEYDLLGDGVRYLL